MNGVAYNLIHAFPEPFWSEADTPAQLLLTQIGPPEFTPEQKDQYVFPATVEGWPVAIPNRLYDRTRTPVVFYDEGPFRNFVELANSLALTDRQLLMFFCLLSRHHNGFVREAALCQITAAREAIVVPFVAQLASEYVYEILMQIRLRLVELDPSLYGAFFRNNASLLAKLRQRMVSYWDCYYRTGYTSVDGELRCNPDDRYIGFEIFDSFEAMKQAL
ncbi:MAG TPA: hypothetical protein VG839_01520 [Asticcacaulis sp.]|nr:hypothetical protein [Asticcacaulis sp.]